MLRIGFFFIYLLFLYYSYPVLLEMMVAWNKINTFIYKKSLLELETDLRDVPLIDDRENFGYLWQNDIFMLQRRQVIIGTT